MVKETLRFVRMTPKCIVAVDVAGKERWLPKEDHIRVEGDIVYVGEKHTEIVKTGSYAEDLILYDEELYDTVFLQIDIGSIKRINGRNKNFTKLLAEAIFDEQKRKSL